MQKTLSILKPDSYREGQIGQINSYIEKAGLKIIQSKTIRLTKKQAEYFYEIHKDRPFFGELVSFMTSGSVVVQVLEGDNAVEKYRTIMGATNPKEADPGTIRRDFANSIDENRVHGSDSLDNAEREIAFFFASYELV